MANIVTRFRTFLRERRFKRSLEPGWLADDLQVRHYAVEHGALGPELADSPAGVEDAIDGWGVTTLAARHTIAAEGAAAANVELEKCRFGPAEQGYGNVLQRYAARVQTILADTEVRLKDAEAQLAAAYSELKRHCIEIAAPRKMAYRERPDGLWKAFALAITVEAAAGVVATTDELGAALSLILCAVLGAVIFILGCAAGWSLQRAWVAKWLGRALFGAAFATTAVVNGAFCVYRLNLADLAAQATGLGAPAASAAAIPPLVLLLAVAGMGAWAWTTYVWLAIYGTAPGVRRRLIRRRRAQAAREKVGDDARQHILAGSATANAEIDGCCADAARRRKHAFDWGTALLVQGSTFDRERESIFAVWSATHGEFAGIVGQMTNVPRSPRGLPHDFPVIQTEHVAGTVREVERDADSVMKDEGRAKLAVASTCSGGLRELDRLKTSISNHTSAKELLA